MNQDLTVSVFEVVGTPLCVASEDGEKVHDRVASALKHGLDVTISFLNVSSLTSAFLNAAVGQLYGEFPEEQIRAHLKVSDMSPDDLELLKRVVDTAKEYFRDPERFREVRRAVMEENDGE